MIGFTAQDDGLFLVWEVEAGGDGASGVTNDEVAAERDMLDALAAFRHGRGRVRYARLAPAARGTIYDHRYGTTLITAHRSDGVTVSVAGDAWEDAL
ncbi:hypothetical protein C1I98_26200 [Spongiactinospora gelatinilytica]|uniref:Uncharacterized protein n=1 Tax=Spongiactinospora gelatinilytica TaxID=2666298 RepID=A0A2W2GI62_9ACTN|nr:hypothetical protein [Spongiactinospora gelatinilytica]PZG36828.1 hypothetical protein C1I98_26200 [Spongiactinospora gelatinilytica]